MCGTNPLVHIILSNNRSKMFIIVDFFEQVSFDEFQTNTDVKNYT